MPAMSLALAIRNRNENIKMIYEYNLLKERKKTEKKSNILWRFKKRVFH